uniref:Peroxisome assembly protein 12 n=1 Tax=Acrobeloides nanus TaxID=290746 RepID=A0A914EFL5_9BILA
MAELGAFRSGPSDKVGQLPTIFDILSQESLSSSLKPALRHLIKFLALWKPKRFNDLNKWFEEAYVAFSFILENHFLKNYGASFAENFYGMKRVLFSTNKMPSTFKERVPSIIILVIWPYIREKMENLQKKLEGTSIRTQSIFTRLFLKFYPSLKTLISVATVIFQLAYILSYSTVPSPYLWLVGARLEKLTPADMASFDKIPLHLQQGGFITRIWRIFLTIPSIFGRLFTYGLFFIQFLEFFYGSNLSKQFSLTGSHKRSTPPRHPLKRIPEAEILNMDVDKCPICFKRRQNDTILSVSGYVFCFTCINDYVGREGLCPVTFLPATQNELVRMYHASSSSL